MEIRRRAAGEAVGVRTFLIADLRGYTRYSDENGDEAASALARGFAAIANDAVSAQGGEVIELRGDEALCVFVSARLGGARRRRATEGARACRGEGEPALPLGVGIGLDARRGGRDPQAAIAGPRAERRSSVVQPRQGGARFLLARPSPTWRAGTTRAHYAPAKNRRR